MSQARSHRRLAVTVAVAAGAALLVGSTSPLVASAVTTGTTAPSAAVPPGLTAVRTLSSLLGTHAWYAQTYRGLPVLEGYYAVHTDRLGAVRVDDGRLAVPDTLGTIPTLSSATAVVTGVSARKAAVAPSLSTRPRKDVALLPAAAGTSTATLSVVGGAAPALVWSVVTTAADGETRTLVDATTGAVREVRALSKNERASGGTSARAAAVTGTATVFDPNPVVGLGLQTLKDRNDSATAVPQAAYRSVTLHNLLPGDRLSGRWATVVSAAGGLAQSANRTFVYNRADDRFEQANAYYGIDRAQTYIRSLGFTDVNAEAQKLSINTIPDDNSFYSPGADLITYGTGGVDDAEDLEVVWHEYGHAIQDAQVPGFGASEQAGAIGEGFGDWWAVTMGQPLGKGLDTPCVMDWDSTSYTTTVPHCLRRTDTGKTVADLDGEVHDDGEIWSNALWDVTQALGREKAATLVLESQFGYAPRTSFASAARVTVSTATTLYGAAASRQVKAAFVARGIL
ncbi:M36 family metallopeptidase [Dermatophilaceae bacterium Soc4.6]